MLSFRVCRGHINCKHMTSRKTVRSEKLIIIGCRNKLNDCKVTKRNLISFRIASSAKNSSLLFCSDRSTELCHYPSDFSEVIYILLPD